MYEQTILLVSPSQELARQIRTTAAALGRQVLHAPEARKAVDSLTALSPGLVITEQRLPDRSGIDLLETASEHVPHAARLLILDSEAPAGTAVEAINRGGATHLLQRPLADAPLRDALQKALPNGHPAAVEPDLPEHTPPAFENRLSERDPRSLQIERLCTIGEMAGNLIHKFNNTLSIILGHIELLQQDTRDPDLQDRLHPVFQSACDGAELTRSLQEFIRSAPSERCPVEINGLIADTLKMTEPIWQTCSSRRRKDVSVHTELGDVPMLAGNPSELREALTNLVLNAVDAIEGEGSLRIATAEAGNWIRIEIQDTGVGIPEAVRQRIFDPFFTTKGQDGNGLGLSIVRRTVHDHGGRIQVVSTRGQGTRFILLLPALRPAFATGAIPWDSLERVRRIPLSKVHLS